MPPSHTTKTHPADRFLPNQNLTRPICMLPPDSPTPSHPCCPPSLASLTQRSPFCTFLLAFTGKNGGNLFLLFFWSDSFLKIDGFLPRFSLHSVEKKALLLSVKNIGIHTPIKCDLKKPLMTTTNRKKLELRFCWGVLRAGYPVFWSHLFGG